MLRCDEQALGLRPDRAASLYVVLVGRDEGGRGTTTTAAGITAVYHMCSAQTQQRMF